MSWWPKRARGTNGHADECHPNGRAGAAPAKALAAANPRPDRLMPARLRRVLKMAEEEGRRRRCTRVTLNTMEIQTPGFYLKQGYEMAAKLDCDPPGVTRYVMTKRLLP
jgi:hypothetical protein